ncbi:MAG: helix-turn-helix transcriptional regulator [Solobacterium sp.]|nr:helix-turn-helix transcriptional regulator [Solobacterium sp.]
MDPLRHHYFKYEKDIEAECYTHKILGFRYNWHSEMFEINIVLRGSMEFCCGGKTFIMEENDINIVNPGVGHASFSLQPDTVALVLHIPSRSFRPFMEKGSYCDFDIATDAESRNEDRFREFRYLCAKIVSSFSEPEQLRQSMQTGAWSLLISSMFTRLDPVIGKKAAGFDTAEREKMTPIIRYIEQHYAEKVTLEDLANEFSYNRTYLSSAFKKSVGVGIYDYLTKIRFQHALHELGSTDKTLTAIALDNGYPELKTFNKVFMNNFHILPSEYRKVVQEEMKTLPLHSRTYVPIDDPMVVRKMNEYMTF